MKLFDDAGDDDVEKISKIEINKEFAKRYEHNKKREDLQKLEEMKKKGLIDDSGSGSESDSESDSFDDEDDENVEKDVKFFEALLKVRKKDPIIMAKDAKLFESSEDDDDEDEDEKRGERKREKPKYLKDVMAQHLMEEGPEFGDEDEKKKKVKSYFEEQEDVRKEVLDALANEERENKSGDDDDFLREKEKQEEDDDDEGDVWEIKKRLDEYFGEDEKLDENDMFLKDFFKNKLWIDKDKGKKKAIDEDDDDVGFSDDEEALERQDDYEREYNFRFEENASDRVLGHSRFVEGSVRKESNTRKQQRERKKEREAKAEIERQEEVKRLKNLKKREIQEKLERIREIAGIDDEGGVPLTEKDLEEDFDPEEFDKKMKDAFGEEYYQAEDVDPRFVDEEGESDLEKPDFDKEDELLGLPKDWDVIKSKDGFLAEREKKLKSKVDNEVDEGDSEDDGEDNEGGVDDERELQPEEGKRKRKRKLSLKEKVALDKELEELYKLDYEDTIGDLKTRFKYKEVAPRKYGLSAAEILCMDEKELNQYVSLKKIAPYREQEWKVHPMLRHNFMKKKQLLFQGLSNGQTSQKKRRTGGGHVGETSGSRPQEDVKAQGEQPSNDESKLSRKARRRLRQKEKKLSQSRLVAYGKIPSSSKSKSKS